MSQPAPPIDAAGSPDKELANEPAVTGEEEVVAADGMRREWNFTFEIRHHAAKAVVRFNPAWRSQFIDPDDIINLNKLDRDVKHCPMMPFASYVDQTIAAQTGAFWEESPKAVRLMYSHIPHNMTLASYCKRSVQHILEDPRVVSVDGEVTLHRLRVGKKLLRAPKIGGKPSFHFSFVVSDKIRARTEYVYAIGTIVGQRGYLITVTCNKEQELLSYVKLYFLPHFRDVTKVQLDADVTYEEVNNTVLKEQQELYGELHFHDRDAAVSFGLPMHPAHLRPDYSPIQSVGVGSIACMTLELEVNQKLMDDFAEADITGMPKYKVNNVLLFLDVEDVARMGYPGLMSVEQYSNAKLKRLVDVFKDAKPVGTPISLMIGKRCGRSATVTFTYEGFGSVVKAMMVSTLVGNMGITALYFTKLGGGLFDAHLYLFQQTLKSTTFRALREESECFSRHQAYQIRLTDQDLPRCYGTAPVHEKKTLEKHMKSLHQSTDGKAEGGKFVAVDVARGGIPNRSVAGPAASAPSATPAAAMPPVVEVLKGIDDLVELEPSPSEAMDLQLDDMEISVSNIPHLAAQTTWEETSPPSPPPRAAARPTTEVAEKSESAVAVEDFANNSFEPQEHTTAVQPREDSVAPKASSLTTHDELALDATVASSPKAMRGSVAAAAPAEQAPSVPAEQLIQAVLKEDEEIYFGPSLHDVYVRCCELQRCRPNSYLLKKLPTSPRFTMSVEELDLTSNYLGHNGFVAVLQLLEHLPRLHSVFFNDMSLDNSDVEHMCEVLAANTSIRSVQLRNNPKITLPATKFLSKLLRSSHRITSLGLQGTRIGNALIVSLEEEASRNRVAQDPSNKPVQQQ